MFSLYELQMLLDRSQHLNHATTQIDYLQLSARRPHDPSDITWLQQLDDKGILPCLEVFYPLQGWLRACRD